MGTWDANLSGTRICVLARRGRMPLSMCCCAQRLSISAIGSAPRRAISLSSTSRIVGAAVRNVRTHQASRSQKQSAMPSSSRRSVGFFCLLRSSATRRESPRALLLFLHGLAGPSPIESLRAGSRYRPPGAGGRGPGGEARAQGPAPLAARWPAAHRPQPSASSRAAADGVGDEEGDGEPDHRDDDDDHGRRSGRCSLAHAVTRASVQKGPALSE